MQTRSGGSREVRGDQKDAQSHDVEPTTPVSISDQWTSEGYLNRQCPRWFGMWGKRWMKHKVIFEEGVLKTFSLPKLRQVDELPVADIDRVEALLLVAPRARVVPLHARAEAPPGEAIAAGLSIYDTDGKEIVFCAKDEEERNHWRDGLRNNIAKIENAPTTASANASSSAATAAKIVVTQGGINGAVDPQVTPSEVDGKGKGKGKHKGKGKGKDKGKSKDITGPPGPPNPPKSGKGIGKNRKGNICPEVQNAKLDLVRGIDGKLTVAYHEKTIVVASAPSSSEAEKKAPMIHELKEKLLQRKEDANNTIFNRAAEKPLDFNPPSIFAPTAAGSSQNNAKKPSFAPRNEIKLLADKAAQELGVVMALLDMESVAAASSALDPTHQGFCEKLDSVEILYETLVKLTTPDADPLLIVRKHARNGGDVGKYRKVERKLAPLSKVPRAVPRLRLLHLGATLDDRLNKARHRLDILRVACQHLEISGHNGLLFPIVRLVQKSMDWSLGQSSGSVGRMFHLGEQLVKLKTIRPPGNVRSQFRPGYNFVHWLVEELFRNGYDIPYGAFAKEVPNLLVAAKTNPSLIYEDLKWLQDGSRTATFELREHSASYAMGTFDDAERQGELPTSGRVAAVTAELLSARDMATKAVGKELPPPTGPEHFLLSFGGEEAHNALRREIGLGPIDEGTAAETINLHEAPCDRPTMLPDDAPLLCEAPRKWDLRQVLAKDRIRKVRLHKGGTFARAARASSAFGLQNLRLSRPSSAREFGGQGMLWLFMPHQTKKPSWHRCYADVRAHHLIIRQVRNGEFGREAAVFLPSADILRLDFLLSSAMSRHLASLGMIGLELRPAEFGIGLESRSPVIICFESPGVLERWEKCLLKESKISGVGQLMMRVGERHARGDARLVCVTDADSSELLCYSTSLDLALGSEPKFRFELQNIEVRPLDVEDEASAVVRGVAQSQAACSLGFRLFEQVESELEIPDLSLTCIASFVVVAPGDPKLWHGLLQTLCIASDLLNTYTALDPGRESLAPNMSTEEDPFSKLEKLRPSCAPGQSAPIGISCLIPREAEETPLTHESKEGDPSDRAIVSSALAAPEDPTSSGSEADDSRGVELPRRQPKRLEESDDDDDSLEEPGPLANLRNLSRKFRREAKALDEEMRAEEFSASTTLAFFDEHTSPGRALASLQVLLSQVAEFGKDFDLVVKKIKDERQGQEIPRPKGKAKAKRKLEPTKSMRDAWVVEPQFEPVEPALEPVQLSTPAIVVEQPTYSFDLADIKRGRLGGGAKTAGQH